MSEKRFYLVDDEDEGGIGRYGLKGSFSHFALDWQHEHPSVKVKSGRFFELREAESEAFEIIEVGSARDLEEIERWKGVAKVEKPKHSSGQFYVHDVINKRYGASASGHGEPFMWFSEPPDTFLFTREDFAELGGWPYPIIEVGSAADIAERAKFKPKEKAEDAAQFYLRRGNEYGSMLPLIHQSRFVLTWQPAPPDANFLSENEANDVIKELYGTPVVIVKVGSPLDLAERERFKPKAERQFYLADRNRDPYDNVWGRRGVFDDPIYWGYGIPKSHFFDEKIFFVVAKMEEGIVAIEVGSPEDKAEREAFAKRQAESKQVEAFDSFSGGKVSEPETSSGPMSPEDFKAKLKAIKSAKASEDKAALDAFLTSIQDSFLAWVSSNKQTAYGSVEWPESVVYSLDNINAARAFLNACGLRFTLDEEGDRSYEVSEIE